MDIRYLIVGAPFIFAFFYTLFWLTRWGAFNAYSNNLSNKMTTKNELLSGDLLLKRIFITRN